jgi:hypothetical protein
MNSVLTPTILNRMMLHGASCMPCDPDDGLFSLVVNVEIPALELKESETWDVHKKYLQPALLAAWMGPRHAPPDHLYGVPRSIVGAVGRTNRFVGRCVQYSDLPTDKARPRFRFDICTDPTGDLH